MTILEKKIFFADFRAAISNAADELAAYKLVLGLMKYQQSFVQKEIERLEKKFQEVEESLQSLADEHKDVMDLVSKKKTEEGGVPPSK